MIALVGTLVAATLALIAALHIYWAAGGRWGYATVLPQRPGASGERVFTPSVATTLAVALALSIACILVAMRSGLAPDGGIPSLWLTIGTWGLGGVFLLRAIGDFKLVGFFKRVQGTPFARADNTLFSPLCLALASGCAVVALS